MTCSHKKNFFKNPQKNRLWQSGCGALFIHYFTNMCSDRFMKGIHHSIQPQPLSYSFIPKKSCILNFWTSVSIKWVNIISVINVALPSCFQVILMLNASQMSSYFYDWHYCILHIQKKNSFLWLGFGCLPFDTINSFYALLKHAFLSFRLSYEKMKECVFRETSKMLFLLILVEFKIHNAFRNHSYFPLRFASMEHSLHGWKIVATLN